MGKRTSTVTTEANHLSSCKNYDMVALYEKLRAAVFETLENVGTGATADYVSWNVGGKRQFANFYIQRKKIRILTRTPMGVHDVGENVPETHLWTLNYQIDIYSDADVENVKDVLLASYRQVALSI